MLNSIKTENQRMTVEIGMDCIMPRIEIANDILYDAWEEFFGNVPQQSNAVHGVFLHTVRKTKFHIYLSLNLFSGNFVAVC